MRFERTQGPERARRYLVTASTGRVVVAAAGIFVCALWAAPSCRRAPEAPPEASQTTPTTAASPGSLPVFVSILPLAYFAERVGGGRVEVNVLVGPGQNPHSFEPTPDQLRQLGRARVLFRVGMPFEEALLPKLRGAFTQLEIVDIRQGIRLRKVEAHEAEPEEAHEHEHEADAGGDDPHIWMDPKLAKIQAGTIATTLARLDPPHADEYRQRLASLDADLDALDSRLAEALAPLRGRPFYVFHPAFGYLADAYGLKQVPVEIEGKEPSAKEVVALVRRAKAEGVKVIFVQPQFSSHSAAVIAEQIDGAVVPLDDLPRDYLRSLEATAAAIKKALSGE